MCVCVRALLRLQDTQDWKEVRCTDQGKGTIHGCKPPTRHDTATPTNPRTNRLTRVAKKDLPLRESALDVVCNPAQIASLELGVVRVGLRQPCIIVDGDTCDRGRDKIEGRVQAVALSDETAKRRPYCRPCVVCEPIYNASSVSENAFMWGANEWRLA